MATMQILPFPRSSFRPPRSLLRSGLTARSPPSSSESPETSPVTATPLKALQPTAAPFTPIPGNPQPAQRPRREPPAPVDPMDRHVPVTVSPPRAAAALTPKLRTAGAPMPPPPLAVDVSCHPTARLPYNMEYFHNLGCVTRLSAKMAHFLFSDLLPRCDYTATSFPSHLAAHPDCPPSLAALSHTDARSVFFSNRVVKSKPERQIHQKVMSVLSRVTPQKYDELHKEMLELPLRQTDDEQLDKVVDVFFHKAVQEPKFSKLYADLVASIFHTADKEAAAAAVSIPSSPVSPLQTSAYADKTNLLANRLRSALLNRCQTEFSRQFDLQDHELVDAEGRALPQEEIDEKKMQLKQRLCGTVRFVGELYLNSIVTDRVIDSILQKMESEERHALKLLKEKHRKCVSPNAHGMDDVAEVFCTLFTTVGIHFSRKMADRVSVYIDFARELSKCHPTPRIKFLMMNLVDLERQGWQPGSPTSPKPYGKCPTPVAPTPRSKKGSKTPTGLGGRFPSSRSFGSLEQGDSGSTPTSPTPPGPGRYVAPMRRPSASSLCTESSMESAPASPAKSRKKKSKEKKPPPPRLNVEMIEPCVVMETHAAVRDGAEPSKLLANLSATAQGCVLDSLRSLSDISGRSRDHLVDERQQFLTRLLSSATTNRKEKSLRQAVPALLCLLVHCPVAVHTATSVDECIASAGDDTESAPWFTAESLQTLCLQCACDDIADGVFDDSPTFFHNWSELLTGVAAIPTASAILAVSDFKRRMSSALTSCAASCESIETFLSALSPVAKYE